MLIRLISILFPVFFIAALGYVYGRYKAPDMRFANQLNMDLFVPALVFAALASKDFQLATYAPLAGLAAVIILGSGLLAWPVARMLKVDWKTFVPPMMFNNSGNMGIPLLVLAFGQAALPGAVMLFLVEMTLHFSLGFYLLDHRTRLWRTVRQPVIGATLIGLAISLGGIRLPDALQITIKMLGDVSVPLLLFSLGVRMTAVSFADWKIAVAGALVCPISGLLLAALAMLVVPLPPEQQRWLWLFAALPPAVLNYIVAEQYKQEPSRVASLVLIGNLASVISMPLVLWFVLPR